MAVRGLSIMRSGRYLDNIVTETWGPTMPDREAHLQAIFENPTDDGARLVFADWLEEQGDPRGEFIRLQIERQRQPTADADGLRPFVRREDELLAAHGRLWRRELPRWLGVNWGV